MMLPPLETIVQKMLKSVTREHGTIKTLYFIQTVTVHYLISMTYAL